MESDCVYCLVAKDNQIIVLLLSKLFFARNKCQTRCSGVADDNRWLSIVSAPGPGQWLLGLNMGTGKPTVFPKWVSWVRVRFWFLAHRVPVPQCSGVAGTHRFIVVSLSPFFLHFKLGFVLFFSLLFYLCHIVMEPNMAVRAACTSSPLPPPPQVHPHCTSKL